MLFRCIFGVKHLAGIGVDQDRTFGSDIQVRAGMLQYALRVEVACFAVDGALSGRSPPVCQKVVAIAGDGFPAGRDGAVILQIKGIFLIGKQTVAVEIALRCCTKVVFFLLDRLPAGQTLSILIKVIFFSLPGQPADRTFAALFQKIGLLAELQPAQPVEVSLGLLSEVIIIPFKFLPARLSVAIFGKTVCLSIDFQQTVFGVGAVLLAVHPFSITFYKFATGAGRDIGHRDPGSLCRYAGQQANREKYKEQCEYRLNFL